MPNGIDCCTIKHLFCVLQQPILLDGIEMLHLTNCYMRDYYFLIVSSMGMKICLM